MIATTIMISTRVKPVRFWFGLLIIELAARCGRCFAVILDCSLVAKWAALVEAVLMPERMTLIFRLAMARFLRACAHSSEPLKGSFRDEMVCHFSF